ncbi:unnamed protein product [Rotaria magnacalcarata]|uniref:Uncharacterized protein n=1 Tax=Rotaria magnacalcarata TaxID=392030 RepID=A0A819F9K9_9BILA|nr:unnamed protein product [Rotaria magnacalcarata]CAF3862851.1 unnamed protein product [Rotaria magnacalcarata]
MSPLVFTDIAVELPHDDEIMACFLPLSSCYCASFTFLYAIFHCILTLSQSHTMSCLVHDKRFRSSFHSVINELRNEARTPVSILQTMPRQCCKCNDENQQTVEPAVMKEQNELPKLKQLIERINRENQTNPKLVLSLNLLISFIEKNRSPTLVSSKQNSSSSSNSDSSTGSEDNSPMDVSRPIFTRGGKPGRKTLKPNRNTPKSFEKIKSGTFVFLPYVGQVKKKEKHKSCYEILANHLQLQRFMSRNGHIPQLEKQYGGFENLKIHNHLETIQNAEQKLGEWVLIRSKKTQKETKPADVQQALEDLMNRWESCLKVEKRERDDDSDSGKEVPKKK